MDARDYSAEFPDGDADAMNEAIKIVRAYPGHSLDQLQAIVHEWANEQFPDREPSIAWMKLFEELGEVIKDPKDPLEWADVLILVLDLAAIYGVTLDNAVLDKMEINRRRTWGTSPTGVMVHTGEAVLRQPFKPENDDDVPF
jgi:NTP pyrophosphatase (non-canonical NTP hydrolase)